MPSSLPRKLIFAQPNAGSLREIWTPAWWSRPRQFIRLCPEPPWNWIPESSTSGGAPLLFFRDLPSAECQPMVAKAAQRQYASRQVIVQEGDEGGEVLVVAGGRVKVSQLSHTGDEEILRAPGGRAVIGG